MEFKLSQKQRQTPINKKFSIESMKQVDRDIIMPALQEISGILYTLYNDIVERIELSEHRKSELNTFTLTAEKRLTEAIKRIILVFVN